MALRVEVKGARGLVPMDPNGASDPYCIVGVADPSTGLFKDPSACIRSKTHYVTLNPVWKGVALTGLSKEDKVRIEIYDKDQDDEDDFEGFAVITVDTDVDVDEKWIALCPRTPEEKVTGDVHVFVVKGSNEVTRTSQSIDYVHRLEELEAKTAEDARTIKRLESQLKSKAAKIEKLEEAKGYLDQEVRSKVAETERLQAELFEKSDQLQKLKSMEITLEYPPSSQIGESDNSQPAHVTDLVQLWDTHTRKFEKMQAEFRSKLPNLGISHATQRSGMTSNSSVSESGASSTDSKWNVQEIVRQWNEYTRVIEYLRGELDAKMEKLDKLERAEKPGKGKPGKVEPVEVDDNEAERIDELLRELEKLETHDKEMKQIVDELTKKLEFQSEEVLKAERSKQEGDVATKQIIEQLTQQLAAKSLELDALKNDNQALHQLEKKEKEAETRLQIIEENHNRTVGELQETLAQQSETTKSMQNKILELEQQRDRHVQEREIAQGEILNSKGLISQLQEETERQREKEQAAERAREDNIHLQQVTKQQEEEIKAYQQKVDELKEEVEKERQTTTSQTEVIRIQADQLQALTAGVLETNHIIVSLRGELQKLSKHDESETIQGAQVASELETKTKTDVSNTEVGVSISDKESNPTELQPTNNQTAKDPFEFVQEMKEAWNSQMEALLEQKRELEEKVKQLSVQIVHTSSENTKLAEENNHIKGQLSELQGDGSEKIILLKHHTPLKEASDKEEETVQFTAFHPLSAARPPQPSEGDNTTKEDLFKYVEFGELPKEETSQKKQRQFCWFTFN